MNSIRTKSILKKIETKDGLRVCIMRGIKPEYKFDLWIPALSPTPTLLKKYVIKKEITWEQFKPLFKEKVILKQTRMLRMLKYLTHLSNVTLLCWETSEKRCHRSIVLQAVKEMKD